MSVASGELGSINRALLDSARAEKLENGEVIRLDSTTSAALLHEPSDNILVWDAVRVMVRLLERTICAPRRRLCGVMSAPHTESHRASTAHSRNRSGR
jgi:hypothetical protein